jgi:hypothetical protein
MSMSLDQVILALRDAARELGALRADEMQLEDERALVKRDAILRLMQTENAATKKPHSASSAEAVVYEDGEYQEHRIKQRDAVIATQVAYARYEAVRCRLRALTMEPSEVTP